MLVHVQNPPKAAFKAFRTQKAKSALKFAISKGYTAEDVKKGKKIRVVAYSSNPKDKRIIVNYRHKAR